MAGNLFIDTNVLVYANNALSPFASAARTKLNKALNTYENLWVSRQVFREFAVIVSREMLAVGNIEFDKLEGVIQQFERDFLVAEDSKMVTSAWLSLLGETKSAGKQVHDANIVATMLAHGIDAILTHNVEDFRRFAHLIEIVPMIQGGQ
jgi:predicted nucleic acid-binding protein